MIMDLRAPSIDLSYPFTGCWLVQNSPADRVPSHGTTMFASAFAIDFVPVDETGKSAPYTVMSFFRSEAPETFPGFGIPVLAPLDGTVVSTFHSEIDHRAHRDLPSVGYAASRRARVAGGSKSAAGNHVLLESGGIVVAVCRLQQGSINVRTGQRVGAGDVLGRSGNSGNSSEPHVHLQAMDDRDPQRAHPVPIAFDGVLPPNGTVLKM